MLALDTNVLIHAHRADAPLNGTAFELINGLSRTGSPWAIPWPCAHEFLATVTHPRKFAPPTPSVGALDQLRAWQSAGAVFLAEGADHLERLAALIAAGQVVGPMVHDARIAAICLSNGITELLTLDRDFSRFPALKVRNPLM